MTDRHPSEPYGENTIERAFLDDIERAFDHDDTSVVVTCKQDHEIEVASLDVGSRATGETKMLGGQAIPIEVMTYTLNVPVELSVLNGEDVRVEGFENNWIFTDVAVDAVTDEGTSVTTEEIHRVYE